MCVEVRWAGTAATTSPCVAVHVGGSVPVGASLRRPPVRGRQLRVYSTGRSAAEPLSNAGGCRRMRKGVVASPGPHCRHDGTDRKSVV